MRIIANKLSQLMLNAKFRLSEMRNKSHLDTALDTKRHSVFYVEAQLWTQLNN